MRIVGCLVVILCGCLNLAFPAAAAPSGLDLARQLNQAFIDVADRVSESVVVIRVAHKPSFQPAEMRDIPFGDLLPKEFRRRFFEERPNRQNNAPRQNQKPVFDGQGSGVAIREEGYIMTNRHVVDGADEIRVRFKDGKEYAAEIRGVDSQSDIAVIKITDKTFKSAKVAKLGDSAKVRVAEFAIAIGAPFDLDYSVTVGHISAKGRSRIIPDPAMDQDFLQTDASINPGNSGGPLVNLEGEVVGINTMIHGLNTGIGFAVPINLAREVADRLISDGKYTRAWLGVAINTLSEDVEFKDVVKGVKEGVVVREIAPDGPAAKAGLKPSDVITAVDGKPVKTSQELKSEIRVKPIGSSVALDLVRDGKAMKLKIKPEGWPEETREVAQRGTGGSREKTSSLGLTVQPLDKEMAEKFDVEAGEGVIITAVEAGTPAAAKGVLAGDVITDINHQPITNLRQFGEALKTADTKKGVIVNLKSKGVSKFVILKEE
jgi:serine protease Do